MKTFLFIGANADLAIEARKLIEKKGDKVIAISRNSNDFYPDFLIGNAVTNELPEITEDLVRYLEKAKLPIPREVEKEQNLL